MTDALTKTVLVVDDEPDVRTYFENALADAGFKVETASDGEQALEKIKARKPDLISLDLVMPRKSGVRLFHELRKSKEWAAIPVLIVTAHARDEMGGSDLENILKESSMSGPGVYLEKPVTARTYVNNISKILGVETEPEENNTLELKEQLAERLKKSDPETLRKLISMLDKKD